MVTLKVTEKQLHLIQTSLDFYNRIGIGQFNMIKDHPTFEKHLHEEFKVDGVTDYVRYHEVRGNIDCILTQPRNMLYNDHSIGTNGNWGIFNPKVDESCREAFDIIQVIRHEFWKRDENRSGITVDSSVHLHCEDSDKIKVKL
tara:strand:- start:12 stop:440 length:429 start_codon:yes stop_codon:yes gene_type:complete